jgi:hypothetical protein
MSSIADTIISQPTRISCSGSITPHLLGESPTFESSVSSDYAISY